MNIFAFPPSIENYVVLYRYVLFYSEQSRMYFTVSNPACFSSKHVFTELYLIWQIASLDLESTPCELNGKKNCYRGIVAAVVFAFVSLSRFVPHVAMSLVNIQIEM